LCKVGKPVLGIEVFKWEVSLTKPIISTNKPNIVKKYTMSMLEIGNNIRRIREIKNYTQEAVADMVGMSVSAYGDIERGKSDVNFGRLSEIAAALEVKPEEIVTFASTVYNNHVTNHDNGFNMNNGTVNTTPENMVVMERGIFEKMMKDKDEEIAFLREQLRKG
jgi:transcriptional regulator with XRE-family HTH domain